MVCGRVWRWTTSRLRAGLACSRRTPAPGKPQGFMIWPGNWVRRQGSGQRYSMDLESVIIYKECMDVGVPVNPESEGMDVEPLVSLHPSLYVGMCVPGMHSPPHRWLDLGTGTLCIHRSWTAETPKSERDQSHLYRARKENSPKSQSLPGLATFYNKFNVG